MSSTPPLSFLIIGAGAIGSYVGGSLALSGQRVVFLDRPEAVAQIRARGMTLRLPDGEHVLKPTLVPSIQEALAQGPFDAGIFSVKSYHTQGALHPLMPFAAQLPPIICLQNGVDNEPLLADALGTDKVIAGTVTTAIGLPGPGIVAVERLRGLGIAVEASSPNAGLTTRIHAAMAQAGLRPVLYPHPADMKWSKLMTNLTANATSAILDLSPADIFSHPGLVWVEMEQQREALRVMQGLGVRVTSLPGTPVTLFAFAVQFLPLPLAQPILKKAIGGGRGGKMPSLHIDLHRGNPQSEVVALNGAVAAHGKRLGLQTPINHALNEILVGLSTGSIPLHTFAKQPEKLLEKLKQIV
ncbi:MAG: 2-dehydropantoate 2-reductase [Anaerolineales bacterium]|nr:2-dehydropantoate 2-reductase [Anaerolineales bacterium]